MNKRLSHIMLFVIALISLFSVNAQTNYTVPYVDPKILEEFNKSSEVKIIVEVRDTSGITVTSEDSEEQQSIKDAKKKEILQNKTNAVLSKLSESEFKLRLKFPINGFSGNVTREGFDKLVNDTNVAAIYLVETAYVTLDKSRPMINADDVETAGYTGLHQTACMLDTGIAYDHPALGGCFGADCKVRGGWDYVNNDGNPDDDNGHGTHVAGIIASTNSNIRGIAPNAKLVAMKVCNASGDCFQLDMESALQYCYINRNIYNISVVSMSIGDGGTNE